MHWQTEWAANKYWVMAHSQQAYNQIRQLAKHNDWTPAKQAAYHEIIATASVQSPTRATLTTAYQHVWGYFKKLATPAEKQFYLASLATLTPDNDQLGPFLVQLTDKYNVQYLKQSRLIQELRD
ncbi:YbgA family protein [Nicoliella lavandulae]|uniref:YbgA family protein n=1 Tax=Nicoliella lavandulae TaxID=3082954 RepID=A0ABU8SKY9_9LACO